MVGVRAGIKQFIPSPGFCNLLNSGAVDVAAEDEVSVLSLTPY